MGENSYMIHSMRSRLRPKETELHRGREMAADRTVARLSAKRLQGNYDAIREQVPGQSILPMIKANAYGHGAVWAAQSLLRMPALYGFGVATLDEGVGLRQG